jgi:low temperature requirement protein LtrA
MWWLYFDTSSKDGSDAIVHSSDPGRIGAYFHYVHVIIVAGVIVSAVGAELVIAHPDQRIVPTSLLVLIAGPALYLLGNAVYKKVVYRRLPLSHLAGLVLLALLAAFGYVTDLLMVGGLAAAILILTAAWESCSRRKNALAYQDEHASQW